MEMNTVTFFTGDSADYFRARSMLNDTLPFRVYAPLIIGGVEVRLPMTLRLEMESELAFDLKEYLALNKVYDVVAKIRIRYPVLLVDGDIDIESVKEFVVSYWKANGEAEELRNSFFGTDTNPNTQEGATP
jgi:hypothetical protein